MLKGAGVADVGQGRLAGRKAGGGDAPAGAGGDDEDRAALCGGGCVAVGEGDVVIAGAHAFGGFGVEAGIKADAQVVVQAYSRAIKRAWRLRCIPVGLADLVLPVVGAGDGVGAVGD